MNHLPPSNLQPQPLFSNDVLRFLGGVAAGVGVAYLGLKVYQALTDEVHDGRTLPRSVRQRLLDEHIEEHGTLCNGCGEFVPEDELTIDHIVPYSRGGLTSIHNSRIRCRSCNSSRGANASALELLVGRG